MLRLPDGMRDRIRMAAEGNGRSMNSEILAVLEKAFPELSPFEEELAKVRRIFENAAPEDRMKLWQAMEETRGGPYRRKKD